MLMFIQSVLIMISTLVVTVDSTCVWYGVCGNRTSTKGTFDLNCKYDGEPKELQTPNGQNLFKEYCKDLHQKQGHMTCCSDHQMELFAQGQDIVKPFLSRCPACWSNFLNMWCHMTCSSDQSNYTKAVSTSPTDQVTELAYAISPTFANGLHSSCRDVQGPNGPFMGTSCGTTSWLDCTATKWLGYLGSYQQNPFAPIEIKFHITNEAKEIQDIYHYDPVTYRPLTFTLKPMNITIYNCQDSCSCTDCSEKCNVISNTPEDPCEILTISCFDFICVVAFVIFLLLFGTVQIYTHSIENKKSQQTPEEISPGQESTSWRQRAGAAIEAHLERQFQRWGGVCTMYPGQVITASLAAASLFSIGLVFIELTTDPVKLWSGPNSKGRIEKDYFDEHFVPFFRTEQLIITRPNNVDQVVIHEFHQFNFDKNTTYTSVFDKDFMLDMLKLQNDIENITAKTEDGRVISLQDICFQPLGPENKNCTIISVFNFFQNSKDTFIKQLPSDDYFNADKTFTYLDHITECAKNPLTASEQIFKESCFGTFGGPIFPWIAFGGFQTVKQVSQYNSSTSLIITFVVNNHNDDEKNKLAKAWENAFLIFMEKYTDSNKEARISYRAEISIENEIERVSKSDIPTIAISYVIMFLYSTFTLGRYRSAQTVFVDSKIMLGLMGVFVVLLSVVASVGILCFAQIPISLIVVEVVPFLVLAVGIDNIFILVKTIQKETRLEGEKLDTVIARVLGKVGPSMLLTSVSESLAFFLGAITNMPAIKWFALYASLALVINFLLQITCFISLIYLDALREEQSRLDLLCCVKIKKNDIQDGNTDCYQSKSAYATVNKGFPHLLMQKWIRPVIVIVFVGYFCASGALSFRLEKGLNQTLAMPTDSYMLDYFNDLSTYLSVGPPVYFVIEDGWDYTTIDSQNKVCGGYGCSEDSLAQQITLAAKQPEQSFIAQPAASWLDDYISWLESEACCRTYTNDSSKFCASTASGTCSACNVTETDNNRPVGKSFLEFLPWFLIDNPNVICGKGGHAAHGSAVEIIGKPKMRIGATYLQTYHTVLKNSSDYIKALEKAREIADSITKSMGGNAKVFPYSVFYVFYEMYLDIWSEAVLNILYCLIAIFVATFFLLGLDIHSAGILVLTIIMILVDTMGLMYMWDIKMNPVSLVNLIMNIGMSVEFCSHIMHAYSCSKLPSRKQRAQFALEDMGGAVLFGIVFTNLIGTVVLAFAKSCLFRVYYFRLYLSTLVFGAAHGLMFLPVLLSYIGPPVNRAKLYTDVQFEGTPIVNSTPGIELIGEKDVQTENNEKVNKITEQTIGETHSVDN